VAEADLEGLLEFLQMLKAGSDLIDAVCETTAEESHKLPSYLHNRANLEYTIHHYHQQKNALILQRLTSTLQSHLLD
jgi:hypothetical protein